MPPARIVPPSLLSLMEFIGSERPDDGKAVTVQVAGLGRVYVVTDFRIEPDGHLRLIITESGG